MSKQATRHIWAEEEIDIIRRDYQCTHKSAEDVGQRLGLTCHQVRNQAYKMGIIKVSDRRYWTPQEEKTLESMIGNHSITAIAQYLKRGYNSVCVKSKRLKLSRRGRDFFTKKEVCEVLGKDHRWVQKRIDGGLLEASWHNGTKPQKNGMAYWHIEEQALRQFIIEHSCELTGRNVDLFQIVNILVG